MKVLHIVSSSGMYGAEAVILNLARTMREGPHDFVLAVLTNSSEPSLQLHNNALKEGFESHPIACQGRLDRATIESIRQLAHLVGADVVHAHGYKADIYVYLALRGRALPLVSTCHTWYDTDWRVSLYGRIDRFVLRRYDRVVAVSDEVRQRLLRGGVRAEKIRRVRNGIDMRPFDVLPRTDASRTGAQDSPVVGLVGRLAWEKGVDLFLLAAAKVLVAVPGARFVVVGDGPDREKLEHLIDELNIRQSVTLLGRRDDMASLYASFDLMVSSSRQEGLPMAVLEGMASGLALVAAAVGELPAVVVDGRTGVLVPAEDVDQLAAAIVDLLRDPEKRAQYGAAARLLIAEKYSAARMTEEYLSVYEEAIAAAKQRREGSAEPPAGLKAGAK